MVFFAGMHILPGWHPIVVHFVIAQSVTAALALLVSRFAAAPRTVALTGVVGTFNLCFSALFAVLAIVSGLAAVWDLHLAGAARAAVSTHVKWAFFTTLALILLAVWRGVGLPPEERPSNLFLVVIGAAVGAVAVTAYFGAENVYRYGVGVLGRAD
jgi:uncharacterized membrane protein